MILDAASLSLPKLLSAWVRATTRPCSTMGAGIPASGRSSILAYNGPAENYQRRFAADVAPLQNEMTGKHGAIGDFEFAPTRRAPILTPVFAWVGQLPDLQSHDEVDGADRQSPNWLAAQKPFVELSEKFRADPLE